MAPEVTALYVQSVHPITHIPTGHTTMAYLIPTVTELQTQTSLLSRKCPGSACLPYPQPRAFTMQAIVSLLTGVGVKARQALNRAASAYTEVTGER